MLFSRGINPTAERDFQRLCAARTLEEAELMSEAFRLVQGLLRFDPHLLVQGWPGVPFRVFVCGPIRVIFQVRPLDDRYVEVVTVVPNVDWIP
jgi:hypothetical protein